MNKFKVGDRVKVYDVCQLSHKTCEDAGIIEQVDEQGALLIKMDTWGTSPFNSFYYHPKQCRKLVKKKAPDLKDALKQLRYINSGPITHERYRQMKRKLVRRWKQVSELEENLSQIIKEVKQIIDNGKTFSSSTKITILQDLDYFYSYWKKHE